MNNKRGIPVEQASSKVPEVVLWFWIIKIALGETGGDWVSMSLRLGYLVDFADRSVFLGSTEGVAIVAALLATSLAVWYWSEGTVSVQSTTRPKVEWFCRVGVEPTTKGS